MNMASEEGIVPLWKQPLDTILAKSQRLRDERASREARATRVAILGGWNTQFAARMLDVLLFERGLDVEPYEAGHEIYVESILNALGARARTRDAPARVEHYIRVAVNDHG